MKIESLSRARYNVSKRHPYLSEALFSAHVFDDDTIADVRFSGQGIRWNPDYFKANPGAAAKLAHEMFHVILDTDSRARTHREMLSDGSMVAANRDKFWLASCIAIDSLLTQAGWAVENPPAKYGLPENKTAEWYYDNLPTSSESCQCLQNRDSVSAKDSAQLDVIRSRIAKQMVVGIGSDPSDEILSFVDRYRIKFDWRAHLSRSMRGQIEATHSESSTFTRVSRKQQIGAARLPGRRPDLCGYVAVIMDTSGSIDDQIRSGFASVIRQLVELTRFYLVTNDAKVHGAEEVYSWREIVKLVRGGGGTDFCPAFAHLEKCDKVFDAIYVLTDGYAYVPIKRPKQPVYWVIYGDAPQPASWGKTIRIGGE